MFAAPYRHFPAICLALLVAVTSPVMPAGAQQGADPQAPGRELMSEDAAVAMVRAQTQGKVVRVDRRLDGGSTVYHIRVLSPDGHLREFRVDAATGSIK